MIFLCKVIHLTFVLNFFLTFVTSHYFTTSGRPWEPSIDGPWDFVNSVMQICREEFPNVTGRDLFIDSETNVNSQAAKCFQHCLATKIGVADDSGNLVVDALLQALPPKLTEALQLRGTFEKCAAAGENVEDKCEKQFKQIQCLIQSTSNSNAQKEFSTV